MQGFQHRHHSVRLYASQLGTEIWIVPALPWPLPQAQILIWVKKDKKGLDFSRGDESEGPDLGVLSVSLTTSLVQGLSFQRKSMSNISKAAIPDEIDSQTFLRPLC